MTDDTPLNERYHTVKYATHTSDDQVHLLDDHVGKSLCGLWGLFEIVDTSDATDGGICEECDGADRPVFRDDGRVIRSDE